MLWKMQQQQKDKDRLDPIKAIPPSPPCFSKGRKPGVPYASIVDGLQSFDAIAFRGSDVVSDSISAVEHKIVGSGSFTHIGMVLRACDFPQDSPVYDQKKVYVFESTASGRLIDGVDAVDDGKGHLGCQLRDLGDVVPAYDSASPKTRMSWLRLQNYLRPPKCVRSEVISQIMRKYDDIRYDASAVDLAAAALPFMRTIRDNRAFRHLRNALFGCCCCGAKPSTWLFCSELVASIYVDLGIFPDSVNPSNVMPMDFFPADWAAEDVENDSHSSAESSSSSLAVEQPLDEVDIHGGGGGGTEAEAVKGQAASSSSSKIHAKTLDADGKVPLVFASVTRFHS